MGKHLDLDDVVGGHPVAERELADLRARLDAARNLFEWVDGRPYYRTANGVRQEMPERMERRARKVFARYDQEAGK